MRRSALDRIPTTLASDHTPYGSRQHFDAACIPSSTDTLRHGIRETDHESQS